MSDAEVLAEIITVDFLRPSIERLGEQLRRNIGLKVKLVLDKETIQREIFSTMRDDFQSINGEVRVLASDTAIRGRYKYYLQCLFPEQEGLDGFSGIRLNGAVVVDGSVKANEYSGFLYTYNEWSWGKKVRDM
jgi:hypothetical protein